MAQTLERIEDPPDERWAFRDGKIVARITNIGSSDAN